MKILLIIIVILIGLIVGTIFLMPDTAVNEENGDTDFSFISPPTITPEPSFADLLSESPNSVHQNVLNNVIMDEYYIYPCNYNGVASNALVLVADYKPDANGMNTFIQAETAISAFENSMYQDWGHIIYGEQFQTQLRTLSFSDQLTNDETVWATKYRVATLSDNSTEIYYGWVLNYIIVAAAKECLLETMRSVYHVH